MNGSLVKKFIVLLSIASTIGCTALKEYSDSYNKFYQGHTNIKNANKNNENLIGMTKQEILDRFGQPDKYNVSHSQYSTAEFLTYYVYNKNTYITISNGVVTYVQYD